MKNPKFVDRESPPVSLRIKKGLTNRFSISEPDTALFRKSIKALKHLKNLGIEIVIYHPPFSTESYNLLEESPKHKEWWAFVTNYMALELKVVSDKIIPIESPADYQLDDVFFIDGFHPAEVFVGLQWEKHAQNWTFQEHHFDFSALNVLNNTYEIPLSYH